MPSRSSSPARVATAPNFIPLEAIRVAAPCSADWNAMHGDDRARFCGSCQKNVYNLSALTRAEAEALILEKEGHVCVRFYQRADGTVLTQECPVGLLQIDKRIKGRLAVAAFFLALTILSSAWATGVLNEPISTAKTAVFGTPTPPPPVMMGAMIAMPPTTPVPSTTPVPPAPPVSTDSLPKVGE